MNKLTLMVIRTIVPSFMVALLSFTFVVMLSDLFIQLNLYLNLKTPPDVILLNTLLFFPTAVYFSLPTSFLFSISFSMGTFYSQNELISIFASGISLFNFIKPLLVVGLLLSVFFFVFNEMIVIPSITYRNALNHSGSGNESLSNSEVTLLSHGGRVIYDSLLFNDDAKTLSGLILVERSENMEISRRIDAVSGTWDGKKWQLHKCRIFSLDPNTNSFSESYQEEFSSEKFDEKPETFRRNTIKKNETNFIGLAKSVSALRNAGLPYKDIEVEFFHRFSFAFTPFIIALLTSSIGGRFKKNIVLLSMAFSMAISGIYYVLQMLGELLASTGILPVFLGTSIAIIMTGGFGLWSFRKART